VSRNAHRHPHTCTWCGEVTIETTLGFRWWDKLEQKIIPAPGPGRHDLSPIFVRAMEIAGITDDYDLWHALYAQRLPDNSHRLMRTTTHEIACARKHGGQPSRRV
jgi:hypothetical protein